MIDGLALAVELATKHLSGDGHLQHIAGELTVRVGVVDVSGALENLSIRQQRSDTIDSILS